VGVDIPERIEVQGSTVELQSFVLEIKRRDTVPAGERERVEEAKRTLRRERLERLERVEAGEVSFEAGEALADAVIGIDRALEALESLETGSVAADAERRETADTERWMNFLRQALGRDDDGPQVRGP
jgi:hypothetical protein